MPRHEAHTHLAEWAALVGADLPDHVCDDEREGGRGPSGRLHPERTRCFGDSRDDTISHPEH